MVNMEGSLWCLPCEEPHWEHECLRQREEEDPGSADQLNFIDTTYTLEDDEYIDITKELLEEVRKRAARRARLEILNQMDEALKERLRKKEILTYSRRNKVPASPSPAKKT
jgi:hypothetical protein